MSEWISTWYGRHFHVPVQSGHDDISDWLQAFEVPDRSTVEQVVNTYVRDDWYYVLACVWSAEVSDEVD